MEYVEILRARRALFWYGIVVVGISLLAIVSIVSSHGVVHGETSGTVPFSDLLIGCAVGAWIVATFVAPGLNAEGATIPITWTRPSAREMIASRFVAVDLLIIVAGYAILLVCVLICIATLGFFGVLQPDGEIMARLALALGSAAMWYGLIVLATARLSGRGPLIAGLSWAAFIVIGGVFAAPFPPLIHNIVWALNLLNPTAYVSSMSSHRGHDVTGPIPFPDSIRAIVTWAIAAVSIWAGIRLWSTREI